jgi:hypothetical protein
MSRILIVFAVALFASLPITLFAQSDMEDVVYLNNGNVLRGIIIEEVPNKSLKVQIAGGSIFQVEMNEVARITKESAYHVPASLRDGQRGTTATAKSDTLPRPYYEQKRRGYFFQSQILLELAQGGVRVINGYRFGRFGHLGLGIGLDLSGPSITGGFGLYSGGIGAVNGPYVPIYLYYSGELLNKRVTPFYAVELGYAAALSNTQSEEYDAYGYGSSEVRGGAMWGLGIGVRFKTKKRVNFSLLLNINAKNVSYREYTYQYDEVSQDQYYTSDRVHRTLVYPGLRFGIGF